MSDTFPAATPELRVRDVAHAAAYYEQCLGFSWDWGSEGLGQVSRTGRSIGEKFLDLLKDEGFA